MNINMDSGCRKAMNPDVALTAAQAQILHGTWGQHRPLDRVTAVVTWSLDTNMAHWRPRPLASSGPLVIIGATDINTITQTLAVAGPQASSG